VGDLQLRRIGQHDDLCPGLPDAGKKRLVYNGGVAFSGWASKGREVVVYRNDLTVLSIPVTLAPEPEFGTPRELFRLPMGVRWLSPTPDGERFLVGLPAEDAPPGIAIAVNWRAGHTE
jgi:hypothetical protein